MQRKNGCHTAARLQMRIKCQNVVLINNSELLVYGGFKDRPIKNSSNKVIAY